MGAAIAEFKRSGLAAADVGTIVAAAGVAHGTFFFHFPTKEHVLLELEQREEERIAKQLRRSFATSQRDLRVDTERGRPSGGRPGASTRRRVVQRLSGTALLTDPPPADESNEHPVIVYGGARRSNSAQAQVTVDADVNPMNSAVFFLLGLYALLTTTHELAGPKRDARRLRRPETLRGIGMK